MPIELHLLTLTQDFHKTDCPESIFQPTLDLSQIPYLTLASEANGGLVTSATSCATAKWGNGGFRTANIAAVTVRWHSRDVAIFGA